LTAAASCAIGGITPLIAAGADLLAVITDLFSASGDSEIAARAAPINVLFEEAHA
jgi:thiamine-phosphate pyrophosphorylase